MTLAKKIQDSTTQKIKSQNLAREENFFQDQSNLPAPPPPMKIKWSLPLMNNNVSYITLTTYKELSES